MLPPPTTRSSKQLGRGESPTVASVQNLLAMLIASAAPTPQASIAWPTNPPSLAVQIPLCEWRPAVHVPTLNPIR